MQARPPAQPTISSILSRLYHAFDAVATWVSQLSWWKFFLFAGLTLIAGQILQNELFTSSDEEVVTERHAKKGQQPGSVLIDDSGIHLNMRNKANEVAAPPAPPAPPAAPVAPATPGAPEADKAAAEAAGAGAAAAESAAEAARTGAVAAESGAAAAAAAAGAERGATTAAKVVQAAGGEVHIDLPPQIADELSSAIEQTVEDRVDEKTNRYHKQASTWFFSFVWLLVLALFGTKALVGGKKRAEAATKFATAVAERESMQRQLSEARMQMMQAQVEPHFLFNTLASVEHLIETNPPRASAMQRSLIQYLRAVLPQMRESNLSTNLGRELDMVTAYLALLKMRMEERLTVTIDVPEGLRSASFPPMMLQSLVENAIKHGLECKPEGGHLAVSAEVTDSKLRVTVADDGVGFGVMPSNGTGLGLSNIRERLKLLHGEAGKFHVAANQPSGVIATIEIPYKVAAKS
jgi:signal transduction histidine kinase